MNYQQFIISIEQKVKQCVQNGTVVSTQRAEKNNGIQRVGLIVKEEEASVSPTIYLEGYYDRFRRGESMEAIASSIAELYQKVKDQSTKDIERIKCFANVKDKIAYKIINYEKNKALLSDTPHVRYLDLAIVFYVLLDLEPAGAASMLIREPHLDLWKVSMEVLYQTAKKNTEHILPFEFKAMQAVVEEMLELAHGEIRAEERMYVLSNQKHSFGAACILYEGMLEQIGERLKENYYILPSSIHEVIVVPESMSPTKLELEDMIQEINETQVEQEEILSGFAYYYSIKGKRLLY